MTRIPHSAPVRLAFLWNNFGPTHADRVDAVARAFPAAEVHGIELYDTDVTYDWIPESRGSFVKTTVFSPRAAPGPVRRIWRLVRLARRLRRTTWFLCHYERPEILMLALFLRLTGQRVYMMADSKFDDMPRHAGRELLKSVFVRPYCGALACGERSRDYLRYLGLSARRIETEYDTLSIDRIRGLSGSPVAPGGTGFAARDFILVARHVPKKNIPLALAAFARFRALTGSRRRLHLCGSGPLTPALRAEAATLGIADAVVFHGFVQTDAVARLLGQALALVLPSSEEQFGLVVIEAQAMGLPVLLSLPCGARDRLVRNWQNGFVFEPDNAEALAQFMALLDGDEALWRRLCAGAAQSAPQGDVAAFVAGVARLENLEPVPDAASGLASDLAPDAAPGLVPDLAPDAAPGLVPHPG